MLVFNSVEAFKLFFIFKKEIKTMTKQFKRHNPLKKIELFLIPSISADLCLA